ncbi:centromere protein Q [Hoplias malabaricus]|uniref:centromere protein Q n=1 Tax=Hoplias malabaricus TaxID=27720 RepID=UPI003462D048
MKPSRGSARSSTQGPKRGCQGQKRLQKQGQKPLPNEASTQNKSKKNHAGRKERKLKGQENWKPLGKSSIAAIDNMLSFSILTLLTLRRKEKEEIQKHFSLLKEQFLVKCTQLPVPSRKSGNMMEMSRQLHIETQRIKHGKQKLEKTEESSREVISKLNQLQGKMDSLEEKCRILRNKLEKEDENAQEITLLSEQAVLRLPDLPARPHNELPLQEQMMKMLPNPKAVVNALQNCKVTGHVNTFLELAHKQADQIVTHPMTTHNVL